MPQILLTPETNGQFELPEISGNPNDWLNQNFSKRGTTLGNGVRCISFELEAMLSLFNQDFSTEVVITKVNVKERPTGLTSVTLAMAAARDRILQDGNTHTFLVGNATFMPVLKQDFSAPNLILGENLPANHGPFEKLTTDMPTTTAKSFQGAIKQLQDPLKDVNTNLNLSFTFSEKDLRKFVAKPNAQVCKYVAFFPISVTCRMTYKPGDVKNLILENKVSMQAETLLAVPVNEQKEVISTLPFIISDSYWPPKYRGG